MIPYEYADKAISLLRKKMVRRFSVAKSKMSLAEFDELNILHICEDLYEDLKKDNEAMFLSLAKQVYVGCGGLESKPDKKWLSENILNDYDPITFYVYMHEAERKEARAAESIIAAQNKSQEIQNAMRYWYEMTKQYCDNTEYEATKKAYEDRGIKSVRWITEEDNRVCSECAPRNGKIYAIGSVPERPHWKCRCHIEPVK